MPPLSQRPPAGRPRRQQSRTDASTGPSAQSAPVRRPWLNSAPWFEVFQHFGRRRARGGETKKPAAFFKCAAGSSLRSGNLGGKTDRMTAAPGVAADLSISGRPCLIAVRDRFAIRMHDSAHRRLHGHTLFELLYRPARIFIPRDDPESLASAPRPIGGASRRHRTESSCHCPLLCRLRPSGSAAQIQGVGASPTGERSCPRMK